jgi:hypothetical protein
MVHWWWYWFILTLCTTYLWAGQASPFFKWPIVCQKEIFKIQKKKKKSNLNFWNFESCGGKKKKKKRKKSLDFYS